MMGNAELRVLSRRADIMAMPIAVPQYTVEQVREFPEDGQCYELLDGVLLVTPSPRPLHQLVTLNLGAQLHRLLSATRRGRIVLSGNVEVGDRTLLIPDILVYPAHYGPDPTWQIIKEWWLAVEVISPSSRIYDREFKRRAYQAIGVETVWIVDPDSRTVEVWEQGSVEAHIEREWIEWRRVRVELAEVWE